MQIQEVLVNVALFSCFSSPSALCIYTSAPNVTTRPLFKRSRQITKHFFLQVILTRRREVSKHLQKVRTIQIIGTQKSFPLSVEVDFGGSLVNF